MILHFLKHRRLTITTFARTFYGECVLPLRIDVKSITITP